MTITNVDLGILITTAAVDAVNPCAIGVLALLLSTLVALSANKNKMLAIGMLYVATVFVTYLLAGLGLLLFIQKLSIAGIVQKIVGVIIIILAAIDIKDFWWSGKGISLTIPKRYVPKIKELMNKVSLPGIIILGIFVAAVELPCTGGPYLAILTLLADQGFTLSLLGLLAIYNFIFVLPLIIIVIAVYTGVHATSVNKWKNTHKKWMRLAMGLLMLGLGIYLLFFA